MSSFQKGDWTNCRYDICEIVKDGDVFCTVVADDVDLVISVLEENVQLKKELFELKKDYIMETYADNPIRRDSRLNDLKKELEE